MIFSCEREGASKTLTTSDAAMAWRRKTRAGLCGRCPPEDAVNTEVLCIRTVRMGRCPPCEFQELYHLEVAMWSKPAYTEMRFGFEVTMYIANR
jgi:coenzyme PQQ precursor peptide PqqA